MPLNGHCQFNHCDFKLVFPTHRYTENSFFFKYVDPTSIFVR